VSVILCLWLKKRRLVSKPACSHSKSFDLACFTNERDSLIIYAVSIKHGLRTTDYGLGIRHGLVVGIKHGLRSEV